MRLDHRLVNITIALFRMARPPHLLLIFFVYALGSLIAYVFGSTFNQEKFWVGILALIPVSMSAHYANEYADYATDALTTRTLYSGGSGALPEMGVPRWLALVGAWISLLIGGGLALVGMGAGVLGPATLAVLGVGALFGWMYSLSPLALARRGWGELDNALLGGVLLPLYGSVVQIGSIDWRVVLVCLPFSGLVFNNLLATTWPDRYADAAVGKYTLATRWPIPRLRTLYLAVAIGSFTIMPVFIFRPFPPVVVLGSFLVLPAVLWGATTYTRRRSPFPTVMAMVLLLAVQLIAWWSVTGFCCV